MITYAIFLKALWCRSLLEVLELLAAAKRLHQNVITFGISVSFKVVVTNATSLKAL